MAQESRVKKTLKNAKVNLIFYLLTLFLSFFSRKIFLDTLGGAFVGLTGTLHDLLGFLNLAELGVSTAIGFLLYKPIFDQDKEKINEIISVMGFLYRRIGLFIFAGGIILSCFLPLFFPSDKTGFSYSLIYFAFYSFLASSLLGYFINYRQTLLGADQRNYIVTAYYQTITIIKTIIQIISAYYTKNYFLWVGIELFFGIVYSIILNIKIDKTYPWLKTNMREGKTLLKKYPDVMKKTKQVFFHRIGMMAQFRSQSILIYAYASLSSVMVYQNYTILIGKVSTLMSTFLTSVTASVGNLIAEGNKEKTMNIYWELLNVKMFMAGFTCVCLYFLIDPFITLWLGAQYILGVKIVIIILASTFISIMRTVNDDFIAGHGLYWDVWAPLAEGGINILFACILGYRYGLTGVICGALISQIAIICLWKPYFLFHWGFKTNIFVYWIGMLKVLIVVLLPVLPCLVVFQHTPFDPYSNFFNWILSAILVALTYLTVTYPLMLLCFKGMRSFNTRLLQILKIKR